MRPAGAINIIVKVTRRCNFSCEYCHDVSPGIRDMPFEVLARTVASVLSQNDGKAFRFIWHGGEPLLMGSDFFRKAVVLQGEFLRNGQSVKNTIQTNGTLLDAGFVSFLKRYGFSVGVSLDGPEDVHDAQRSMAGGRKSFDSVLEGIRRLQDEEVPFGVLSVLTSRTMRLFPRDLLDFYRFHGITSVGFLPVRKDCQLNGESLPAGDFGDYMVRLFDEWLSINDPGFEIREFRDWIALALGLPGTRCSSAATCIGGTYSVEPDGCLYSCDKFAGDSRFLFGDVGEIDFDAMEEHPVFRDLSRRDRQLPSMCSDCPWRRGCGGGCGHDRYLRAMTGESDSECFLRRIIAIVRERIERHPSAEALLSELRQKADPDICGV